MISKLCRLLLLLLVASQASALVIRHDTDTIDYENYGKDSRFNASTGISRADNNEYGIAGATAIDSRWGVHARHTLRHVETWMDAGNQANLRGTKWSGWNFQGLGNVKVSEVIHFDDDFSRFANPIDIAIVKTVAKSSTLRIAPLCSAWDEVGRVGSGASAANNRQDGNGNSRKTEAQNTSNSGRWYEVRWAGKNDINQVNGQALGSPSNALLKVDFDHPTNTSKSVMGGNTAIDLEYGTMNGDSGSPIYLDKNGVNGQVAGVVSGGTGNEYGDTAVYVRIRPYRTWITDTILANPDSRAVYIATIPDQTVNLGETLTVTETSTGTEQGPLTPSFSLVNAPSGMTIDPASGVITWTPTPVQAGQVHTITVKVTEDGVVANSKTKSFNVTVVGSNSTTFWTWSAAPPNWSAISPGGGAPYGLTSAAYPSIQGDANTQIYQQISGTIPAWATVNVQIKAADFHQTWSTGGPLEYGFRNGEPTLGNAADAFLHSGIANVPNYDSGTILADGLGNTGGNVDYSFSFDTTTPLTDPWISFRKNADGNRFAVDDINITWFTIDTDNDGLPNPQELGLGTDPDLPDTDGDGLNDGAEVALGSNPLNTDSDQDAFADGYEMNTLGSNPLDGMDPPAPGNGGIGINFVTSGGLGANVALPVNALAGVPDVAQRNWNQLSAIAYNTTSCTTAQIGSPQAGAIVDSTGTPTSMTMSCAMANLWSANNEKITPYGPLYSGYLDTSGGTPQASISLTGIPYAEYDVYVHVGAGASVGRTGRVTDGSTTYSFTTRAGSTTTVGSYVRTTDTGTSYPSASYAKFSGKTGSSLTITYLRGDQNGGIHAIQIVPVINVSDYDQWAIDNSLDPLTDGAASFDADNDGNSNLVEFALASDPSDSSSRPVILMEQDATHVSITYDKSKLADSALATAEWSDNLTDWFTTGITQTEVIENPTSITYKAEVLKGGQPARYLRVKISVP